MIPLYGFYEGDTLGLLMLATADMTIGELARRLEESAKLRAAPQKNPRVLSGGRELDKALTVAQSNLTALDVFEVREGEVVT